MEKYEKLHIEIDIENITPQGATDFSDLHANVKIKGDIPPAWLGLAVMYLCKSYEKEMRKRKALKVKEY